MGHNTTVMIYSIESILFLEIGRDAVGVKLLEMERNVNQ